MIKYSLQCAKDHDFEGWFASSDAYDAQAAKGAISCPACGDSSVRKAIMAPSVKSPKKAKTQESPDAAKMQQFMAGYRKFVEENADYVGPRFPEEARKIHYGETEERHIYGEATLKEAKELIEEGVQVAPVPPAPEDLN